MQAHLLKDRPVQSINFEITLPNGQKLNESDLGIDLADMMQKKL